MRQILERRQNQRIRFSWPIWYGYEDNGELHKGHIQDLSQEVVCFSIDSSGDCLPKVGDYILTRFSFPLTDSENFGLGSYLDWTQVIRTDITLSGKVSVALRLHHPIQLSDDPATYSTSETPAQEPVEVPISA